MKQNLVLATFQVLSSHMVFVVTAQDRAGQHRTEQDSADKSTPFLQWVFSDSIVQMEIVF